MNDKRRKRYIVGFLLLTAAVVILLLLNLGTGSVRVSPEEILSILVKGETAGTKAGIILDIRIPLPVLPMSPDRRAPCQTSGRPCRILPLFSSSLCPVL